MRGSCGLLDDEWIDGVRRVLDRRGRRDVRVNDGFDQRAEHLHAREQPRRLRSLGPQPYLGLERPEQPLGVDHVHDAVHVGILLLRRGELIGVRQRGHQLLDGPLDEFLDGRCERSLGSCHHEILSSRTPRPEPAAHARSPRTGPTEMYATRRRRAALPAEGGISRTAMGGPAPPVGGLTRPAGPPGGGTGQRRCLGWGSAVQRALGTRSCSRKRVQRNGVRSKPFALPCRTTSERMSPMKGECLKPWPLQPKSAYSPAYSAMAPSTGW